MPDYSVHIFPLLCAWEKQEIVNKKIERFLTSRSQVQLCPVSVLLDRVTFEELHDVIVGSW